jgi:hypothetical protein
MRENFENSSTREALEAAFTATIYRVETPEARFDLRIGQINPAFDGFLRAHNVSCWGIITAWNPGATSCPKAENDLRQKHLHEVLKLTGARFFAACNMSTEGTWPYEPAYLILQRDAQQLCAIAAQFAQYALVYGELGQAPCLLWI